MQTKEGSACNCHVHILNFSNTKTARHQDADPVCNRFYQWCSQYPCFGNVPLYTIFGWKCSIQSYNLSSKLSNHLGLEISSTLLVWEKLGVRREDRLLVLRRHQDRFFFVAYSPCVQVYVYTHFYFCIYHVITSILSFIGDQLCLFCIVYVPVWAFCFVFFLLSSAL